MSQIQASNINNPSTPNFNLAPVDDLEAAPSIDLPADSKESYSKRLSRWADNNRIKTGIAVMVAVPLTVDYAVKPLAKLAKDAVMSRLKPAAAGAVGEVVTGAAGDKTKEAVKNAFSVGDALGFVAGSLGKLVK